MLKRCVCFSPVESSRTNSTFVRFPYMEMSPACAKAWTMFIFSSGTSITLRAKLSYHGDAEAPEPAYYDRLL